MSSILCLLALMNPIGNVFILAMMGENCGDKAIRTIAFRATGAVIVILMLFAICGSYLLTSVFNVKMHSVIVAGGVVLFMIGFRALFSGVFFELQEQTTLTDASIVPLASPMIAGPATITAVITLAGNPAIGLRVTIIALVIAAIMNLIMMLWATWIHRLLMWTRLMGAMIRVTGLVIMAIAIEMILQGIAIWHHAL